MKAMNTKQTRMKNVVTAINSELNLVLVFPLLAILINVAILAVPLIQDRYSYSQSPITNSTENMTTTGVDLIDIHPSPLNVKMGNTF